VLEAFEAAAVTVVNAPSFHHVPEPLRILKQRKKKKKSEQTLHARSEQSLQLWGIPIVELREVAAGVARGGHLGTPEREKTTRKQKRKRGRISSQHW
jgi:hypothetical protein